MSSNGIIPEASDHVQSEANDLHEPQSTTDEYQHSPDLDDDNLEPSAHDVAERNVAYQALDSFHKYRSVAHSTIHRRRQNLYALPSSQWRQLAAPPFNLLDNLSAVDDAIDANARLAEAILNVASQSMNFPHDEGSSDEHPGDGHARANDHNKAESTLRQFYRDWSKEGFEKEVKPLLDLILADLATYSSNREQSTSSTSPNTPHNPQTSQNQPLDILLPGSGLSRLLLSLTLHGHNATGNEISYHQLMASHFILNANTAGAHSWTIYPWATNFSNTISRTHQLRSYTIPDIDPATVVADAHAAGNVVGTMGMAAGDFVTSFNEEDSKREYDAVVTVYFIDTAPNLFRYIQTVHNCLRQGGLWINVGPLLWHFDARANSRPGTPREAPGTDETQRREDAGIAEPGSFELTHEEVVELVARSGFEILKEEILADDGDGGVGAYIQQPDGMMQMRYRCGHWVARKL